MKEVADKLRDWTTSREVRDPELFCRSAFNRYYYSAFLITREMLGALNPTWKGTAHGNIPELLKNGVVRQVRNQVRSNERSGIINSAEASRYRERCNSATSDLAEMLNRAYSIRVLADYDPEEEITVTHGEYELDSYTLSAARRWPDRASTYCGKILSVWRDLGLG